MHRRRHRVNSKQAGIRPMRGTNARGQRQVIAEQEVVECQTWGMAVNGGRRLPSFDRFSSGSSSPSCRLQGVFEAKRRRQPQNEAGSDLNQRPAPCCERTLDAYTVEDALNRHERAVEQLTMAIEHVAQSNLPADSKRDANVPTNAPSCHARRVQCHAQRRYRPWRDLRLATRVAGIGGAATRYLFCVPVPLARTQNIPCYINNRVTRIWLHLHATKAVDKKERCQTGESSTWGRSLQAGAF
jgi:hypothetical protein